MTPSLFNDEVFPPLAARLAPPLRALAERGVYFGTSSWKYEGWLDTIYTRERYVSRGKFSRKRFEAECLREYAATFPAVARRLAPDCRVRLAGWPAGVPFREQPPGRKRSHDDRSRCLRPFGPMIHRLFCRGLRGLAGRLAVISSK